MKITITTTKTMTNGIDLKNLCAELVAQYTDGTGAFCLPAESRFGLTESGQRISARHADAATVVEITNSEG